MEGICKQKRITVNEKLRNLLFVASLFVAGALLLVVIIVLAAAANILVPTHAHLLVVVLITIDLGIIMELH